MANQQQIQVGTWFSANHWFAEKMGRGVPNPFTTPLEEVGEYNQARSRLTYETLGDFGMGSPDPKPSFSVPQHDGRLICATAYGAPYPTWNEITRRGDVALLQLAQPSTAPTMPLPSAR